MKSVLQAHIALHSQEQYNQLKDAKVLCWLRETAELGDNYMQICQYKQSLKHYTECFYPALIQKY